MTNSTRASGGGGNIDQDIAKLEAQVADHEQRIAALEAGTGTEPIPPEPQPETGMLMCSHYNAMVHLSGTGMTTAANIRGQANPKSGSRAGSWWPIDRTHGKLKMHGLRSWDAWHNGGVKWDDLNPSDGQYNWKNLKDFVDVGRNAGGVTRYIWCCGSTPLWTGSGSSGRLPTNNWGAWDKFVRAWLTEFGNPNSPYFHEAFFIWNEPNVPHFYADPNAIGPLVEATKRAKVIRDELGSPTKIGSPEYQGGSQGYFDQYCAGAKGHFEIIGHHPYRADRDGWRETLAAFKSVAEKHGLGHLERWVTESGYEPSAGYNHEGTGPDWTEDAFQECIASGIKRFYWYTPDANNGDNTGKYIGHLWNEIWPENGYVTFNDVWQVYNRYI